MIPGLGNQIRAIFANTADQTRADIAALWERTRGRGRRWDSCRKAAALLDQARWPAEKWIGETLLGQLVCGEITLTTFRVRWARVQWSPEERQRRGRIWERRRARAESPSPNGRPPRRGTAPGTPPEKPAPPRGAGRGHRRGGPR